MFKQAVAKAKQAMQVGEAFRGGGVYLPNKLESNVRIAIGEMLCCKTRNLKFVWDGPLLYLAFLPLDERGKADPRTGTIFQKLGNRLVFIPNDGWWPYSMQDVIAIADGRKQP